ncbi:MAG TPA: hypothetical protein VMO26_20790 [Vicinamibacterales bacterium]|nr:hypothetical protein [Vicinamibacterales bacterium]
MKRTIVQRTRGYGHGPIVRLMSPSDLGEQLKPFVFLDLNAGERVSNGELAIFDNSEAPITLEGVAGTGATFRELKARLDASGDRRTERGSTPVFRG